jgi:hypothetical protein
VSFEPANAPEERLGLLMAGGGHRQEHTSA